MYVYSMYAGNYIKIGITQNINSRIKQVQTGTPLKIHKVKYFIVNGRMEALLIEKEIHSKLADFSTHGEWFYSSGGEQKVFIDAFNPCVEIKLGKSQIDKSFPFVLKIERENDYKKLIKIHNDIVNTYECSFINYSKEYILNLLSKKLNKFIGFTSEQEKPLLNHKNKLKKLDKFYKNHPNMIKAGA